MRRKGTAKLLTKPTEFHSSMPNTVLPWFLPIKTPIEVQFPHTAMPGKMPGSVSQIMTPESWVPIYPFSPLHVNLNTSSFCHVPAAWALHQRD